MKRISIVISILLFISLSANAQFGVRGAYSGNSAPTWNTFFDNIDGRNQSVFSSSYQLTLDYWLRLPNKRIEFYPNISFHQANTTLEGSNIDLQIRQLGAGLITHFYVLDFVGDCECPTFGKDGGILKKGLFLMTGVGADYAQKSIGIEALTDGNIDIKASFGLGVDIGISNLVTVTPFIQYQRYFDVSWHELGIPFGQESRNVSASMNQFQLGIRVGFRPDYK